MGSVSVFVAVVHDAGGVIFLAAAGSRRRMFDRLGNYVRRNAPAQLHAEEAAVVGGLLERGFSERAVRYYFAHVGRRWSRERLHVQFLPGSAEAPPGGATDGEAASCLRALPGSRPHLTIG